MIREDRELLAQLARLGREMAPLAMRMMDGSASQREQQDYAPALIAAGERLQRRTNETTGVIIEGEVLEEKVLRTHLKTSPKSEKVPEQGEKPEGGGDVAVATSTRPEGFAAVQEHLQLGTSFEMGSKDGPLTLPGRTTQAYLEP